MFYFLAVLFGYVANMEIFNRKIEFAKFIETF